MKVELSLFARRLSNVAGAFRGTSNPFCVVTLLAPEETGEPVVLGKTEVVQNTLHPDWTQVFVLDYTLGKPMHVAIGIFHAGDNHHHHHHHHYHHHDYKSMGSAMFEIGSLLGAKGNVQAKRVKGGGSLFAHVAPSMGMGTLQLRLRGIQLKNTEGFLRKSDPFFELLRRQEGPAGVYWDNAYRSCVVRDNLSPIWELAVVSLSTLCRGDLHRPIKIQVFDYEKSGNHVLMGEVETTVQRLLDAETSVSDEQSINMDKAFVMTKGGKSRDGGKIVVTQATLAGMQGAKEQTLLPAQEGEEEEEEVEVAVPPAPTSPRPTFVDYMSGGCQLHLCVAIDFTASNGNPLDPKSLHYLHRDDGLPLQKNDYEKALEAIGHILAPYDANQMFPVWGFGAKYEGVVRHCFQVGPSEEAHGVEGILEAYRAVFRLGVVLSGPTVFDAVVRTAGKRAQRLQDAAFLRGEQAYTVLLIVTDGSVSDPQATARALDSVSDTPLSVVIVGVGEADFSTMHFLDNDNDDDDDDYDCSFGKRNLVQFVKFNAHQHSRQSLTLATLDEIPRQLEEYFWSKNILPRAAVVCPPDEIVVKDGEEEEEEEEEEEIDLSLAFGDNEDDEIVVAAGGRYGSDRW